MKTLSYTVTVKVDDEVTSRRLQEHIKDAVENWGGQYHPDDELFSAKLRRKVNVKKAG